MPLAFFNHPLLLAAVAVVAIGVVIYELLSGQEEKPYGGRGPSSSPKPPPPPNDPPKPPPPPKDSPKPPPSPKEPQNPPPPPKDPPNPPRPPNDPQKPPHPPSYSGKRGQNRNPSLPPDGYPSRSQTPMYSPIPPHPPGNWGKRGQNRRPSPPLDDYQRPCRLPKPPRSPKDPPKPPPPPDYSVKRGQNKTPSPPPDDYPSPRQPLMHSPIPPHPPGNWGKKGQNRRPSPPPDDYRRPRQPPNYPSKPPRFPGNLGKTHGKRSTFSAAFKDSETSNELTTVSHSNRRGNNLRRRNLDRNSNEENYSAYSKNAGKDASRSIVKIASEIPSASSSQNNPDVKFDENNYSQNMLDKFTNDTKNVNKNIKYDKFWGHNIFEEGSDSSEESNEEKLINRNDGNNVGNSKKPSNCKRKSKHAGLKSTQNNNENKHHFFDNPDQHKTEVKSGSQSDSDDSVTFTSMKVTKMNKNATVQGSQSSNLYPKIDFHPLTNLTSDIDKSSSSSDEDIYKRQVHETLINDVYGSKENHSDNSVIDPPERIEEAKSTDPKICRGCEEKHVNTCAYPCNHSYLCVDCAAKIFRLYKKCTICHAHVKEFCQVAP